MSEDKEIERIKRNIRTDENSNLYYCCNSYSIVKDIQILISKISKLEKVREASNLLINSFNDENPASISMVKDHIQMQEDYDKALKELEEKE